MHLKRLEVQGFKTFAGRTVFEFPQGVTAVVGPNGSGKSNLGDAVRWVLGEQSHAALRCKRTEELLFAGGTRRPPAGLAEVSLTLDNSDRLLPLDFDEVTFTRRATRAGDNEYYINRARVRLRDVQEATGPLGGSYTIINQGLVDTALTLRPEERRRLFEDAAEIGGFEARKNETERRLRETDANMQRVADLLGELEPRLRALKRQAAQARQQRELREELGVLLQLHYAAQWRAALAARSAAEQDAAAAATVLDGARVAQGGAAAALRALRVAQRELRERLGGLHQQSSALHRHAEAAQRELAVGNERGAALTQRIEELERGQGELQLREQEAGRELAEAQAALAAAEAALAEQRVRVRAREAALAEQEAQRRELARELARGQDVALKAATALAEQRSRHEQHTRQHERLLAEQAAQHAAQRTAAARRDQAQAQAQAAQANADAARSTLEQAQQAEEAARAALDEQRRARASADERLAAARRALADAEARKDSLERLARSYAGTFAGVKAAMQWAERAGRPGFALVAALLRTPAQLETAIEVALGSRLQNIVVEQWQDAEEAIAELKRTGAGRATFLPLDTLDRGSGFRDQGSRELKPEAHIYDAGALPKPGTRNPEPRTLNPEPETRNPEPETRNPDPPVLGIAAQLVDYDARYRAVVYHLLGRTLVVRDMPTARQELRRLTGGWGIVTLGGEQVSSGGALTGGALTRESGALRRERELRELPQQVAQAAQAVAAAEAARGAFGQAVGERERALREAEALRRERARVVEACGGALTSAQRELARAEQELGWQHTRGEASERELAALAAQQQALAEGQMRAQEAVTAAQAQLEALRVRQEQQASADGAIQAELAELRAALAAAEGQAGAARAVVAGRRQLFDRLTQQHGEGTRRLEELARERTALLAQRTSIEERHHALLEQIDQLRALIGPAEEALAEQETRQQALEAEEAAATTALLEREGEHGRATLEAERAHDRIAALRERAAAEGVELADEPVVHEEQSQPGTDYSELQSKTRPELVERVQNLKTKIERLGTVNPLALEEYEQASDRHSFLSTQLADLRAARDALHELIAELEESMQARFASTFKAVALEFERSFSELFGGGSAQLLLVGAGGAAGATNGSASGIEAAEVGGAQPAQRQGIEIIARPPGKRPQNLALLSGGERTLTAAALLFAILKVNPSPFCILDEVDAALDESNVGRFRAALLRLTEQTQFVLITHNRGTIEAADTLYGISMGEDSASRVLSLRLEELVEER